MGKKQDAGEIRLINPQMAQVRVGLVMIEVGLPTAAAKVQRPRSKREDGTPDSSPPVQAPQEQKPSEGIMPKPPPKRARPPIEPGVMAFVHLGPSGVAVPSADTARGRVDLLSSHKYLESLVRIEELSLPENDLRRRIQHFRNRAPFPPGTRIVLDVRVDVTIDKPVKLPDFATILRDQSYFIEGFRLIKIADKN